MGSFKKSALVVLLTCTCWAARADFSGDYAPANWSASTQNFGCGTSSVDDSTAPASISFLTHNYCADIGVWYSITAPKAGDISFSWNMPAVSDNTGTHSADYQIDGTNTTISSLPGGQSASGTTTFSVTAGQQITLHFKGRSISRFDISSFNFMAAPAKAAAAPVPVSGVPALFFGALSVVGVAGFLMRRRKAV